MNVGMRRTLGHVNRGHAAIVIALCASGFAWAQSSAEKFDESFRELKRDSSLQFELPPAEPKEVPNPPPGWLQAILDFLAAIFGFIGIFLPFIFYGLLALAVLAILYFVMREVVDVRWGKKKLKTEPVKKVEKPLYAPTSDEARVLLETVDALAAAGKYGEAVHTLLFRSIQDIDLKRPNTIRRSLTSREIAGLDILTPATRDAFSLIGRVVENSYFGGHPIGQPDFEKCREAYVQFAVPQAWAA